MEEAREYGLPRATVFFLSRVVSSWSRSSGGCGFRGVFWVGQIFFVFFRFYFFVFLRTHTACCKYEAASCLIYLSTSITRYVLRISYHTYTLYVVHMIRCQILPQGKVPNRLPRRVDPACISMLFVPHTAAAASNVLLLCFGFAVLSFRSWSRSVYVVLFCLVCHISEGHGTSFLFIFIFIVILLLFYFFV